jgi:hypothetical protein
MYMVQCLLTVTGMIYRFLMGFHAQCLQIVIDSS